MSLHNIYKSILTLKSCIFLLNSISDRCEEVVTRRLKVKENSTLRKHKLIQSKDFLEFRQDADEVIIDYGTSIFYPLELEIAYVVSSYTNV